MRTLFCLLICLASQLVSAQSLKIHEKILSTPKNDLIFGGTRMDNRLYLSLERTNGYIFNNRTSYSTLYKTDLDLNPVDSVELYSLLGFDSGASNRMRSFGDTCLVNLVFGTKSGEPSTAVTVIDTNLNLQEAYYPDFGKDTSITTLEDAFLTPQHLIAVGSGQADTSGSSYPLYMVFDRADEKLIHANFLTNSQIGFDFFTSIVKHKNKYALFPLGGAAGYPVILNSDFSFDSANTKTSLNPGVLHFATFNSGGTLYGFGRIFREDLGMVKFDSSLAVSRVDTYNLQATQHTIVGNDNFVQVSDTSFIMVGSQDPIPNTQAMDSSRVRDVLLYKVGASGNALCSGIFKGNNYYFPMQVISAPDGGAYIFSNKYDHKTFTASKTDLSVIKVDSNCQLEKFLSLPTIKRTSHAISVYPNPTSCEVSISGISEYEYLRVKVYNNQGQCVLKRNLGQSRNMELCNAGAPGMYLLHFLNENNEVISRKKIVVK